jgi:hypothetical protein
MRAAVRRASSTPLMRVVLRRAVPRAAHAVPGC